MSRTQESFCTSFWSSSAESIPNYLKGVQALHDKLSKSVIENEAILTYLRKRIDIENQCADLMSSELSPSMTLGSNVMEESTMNASLRGSFETVCRESSETAQCLRVRAGVLAQDVLAPLERFTRDFQNTLTHKRAKLENEIVEYEHAAQSALMTRSVYWSRCHALELIEPDFRSPIPPGFKEEDSEEEVIDAENDAFVVGSSSSSRRRRSSSVTSELNIDHGGVRLGKYTLVPYQEVARSISRMQKMIEGIKPNATSPMYRYLGKDIFEWVRDYLASPPPTTTLSIQGQLQQNEIVTLDTETMEICNRLLALNFLKSVSMEKEKKKKKKNKFDLSLYYEVQHNVLERYLRKTRIKSVDYGQPTTIIEESGSEVQDMALEVPLSSSSSPTTTTTNVTSTLNNLFDRFKPHKKKTLNSSTKAHADMVEADEAYKKRIKIAEEMRKRLEERMFDYFNEMEQLEMDRINAVKHAFVTMSSTLTDTLSMFKETYNRITLFQETLKPEQDIQYIIEQCKTGPYCPKPMIYENYYYGSAINQLFGVPLEEVAQIYGSYVPPIVTKGIQLIDAGLSLKRKDEMEKSIEDIWCNTIPMKELNVICDHLNGLVGTNLKKTLATYDLPLLANLIRTYLLELPECLLTFDLYEPIKIIYTTQQDTESRLVSVSKLLATLPSTNYHTLKALMRHLFQILKPLESNNILNQLISIFGHILMRPCTYSASSIHDRHPKKLVRDLLTHYDIIFTKDMNQAQQSSANRSTIIADPSSSFLILPSSSHTDNDSKESHNNKEKTNVESVLRRTLMNIMRRNSAEIGSHEQQQQQQQKEDETPKSPNSTGPPVVPHATRLTLFEDPEKSHPTTPKHSGTTTPQEEEEALSATSYHDMTTLNDSHHLLSTTDVSLILDMKEDDAVELPDKEDVHKIIITPNRSRASTRGTMDNIDLDPFFDDN
ncbi:uncharacterized protein BX663DRAFT_554183 [Cokeromyces recurvatus]|uniref:uncharacterized protein n=1 Tax=Cokeromyces recurvatus TaxID=90255 RepID=UPI00221EFF62|nr:uncharacterized protein BX663DRAFT_554183 [Cokeromyces recurvatus]KAI7900286.1 hypothetical protein BX663DRAFT_554183 [Cokeromyces recurvatus]